MRQLSTISQLIVFFINTIGITLAITVSLSKTQKILRNIFWGMTLLMFIWVDFAFLARMTPQVSTALLAIRLAWAITPTLLVLMYWFLVIYTGRLKAKKNMIIVLEIIALSLLTSILFSHLIIDDVLYDMEGHLSITYGPFIWAFFIFIPLLVLLIYKLLTARYQKLKNSEEKKRITYLIIGLTVFLVMNTVFNTILPVFFHIVYLYELGDYSTIILMTIIAYASLRHDLFRTRVVITTFAASFIGTFLLVDAVILTQTLEQRLIKGLLFLIFIPFADMLIRSVLQEIKHRERLAKANKRIKSLAQEQKDIIDVMGHEIRTPLTAIVQEIKLGKKIIYPNQEKLVDGTLDDKTRKQMIDLIFDAYKTIDNASIHAVRIVTDMLETARLDKKRFELDYEKFDLMDLVKMGVETMSKTTSKEKAVIQFKKAGLKSLEVNADKNRIREALFALINNAIKYKNPKKEKATILVMLKVKDGFANVIVKDDGLGIKEEDIAKLGKKFVRLEPRMSGGLKRPGGTGLGLFVTVGIMEKHGGKLIIESDGLGKGSTFTLQFPVKKNEKR